MLSQHRARLLLALLLSLTACMPTPSPVTQPQGVPRPPSALPATRTLVPTPPPPESGVRLYYADSAQIELIGPTGTRVLFDVMAPSRLSQPPSEADILLTTHRHSDHVNEAFLASFPGEALTAQAGEIARPDVTVRGIPSAHNAGDPLVAAGGTNYIFVVDMAGLRFVHFGDIGQEALTGEQLEALGTVDVAITQLSNSFSAMDADNKKGFALMGQVNPRLVIPTHNSMMAARHANDLWHCVYSKQASVFVTDAKLEGDTHCLLLGDAAATFQQMLKLPVADW